MVAARQQALPPTDDARAVLAKELLKRWESLAKEYQNSDMASFEAWAKVFEDPANQLQ